MTSLHWYFAYGSNMARARLEERVGQCRAGGRGWLEGYDLRFHKRGRDGSGKCDAFQTRGRRHVLHGVVFGMRAEQREALHRFEGPDYAVTTVEVAHVDGPMAAFVYVARAHAIETGLAPFDWYKAFVATGAREAGLPLAYQARIDAQPALQDPDAGRARANRSVLRSNPVELSPAVGETAR